MRRAILIPALFWLIVLSLPLAAQKRGMYGGVSTGQVVGTINDPGFAGRLGATISGLPQTGRRIPVEGSRFNTQRGVYFGSPRPTRTRTVVVPWGAPVYYGGYSGVSYMDYSYPGAVQAVPVQAVPEQQSPTVIINQYFSPETVRPQLREYHDLPEARPRPDNEPDSPQAAPAPAPKPSAAPPPQQAARGVVTPGPDEPTITLLAMNDSTVLPVIAYWLEGDTLHYITRRYEKRTVDSAQLDRELSEKLNRERQVEFVLESMR